MFWLLENEELGSIKTLIVCPKRGDGDGDEAGEREKGGLFSCGRRTPLQRNQLGLDWIGFKCFGPTFDLKLPT